MWARTAKTLLASVVDATHDEMELDTKHATDTIELAKSIIDPGRSTRPGPLVVVGRFYVSLTVVLALAATAAGYIDRGTAQPIAPQTSVVAIRYALLGAVGIGLAGAVTLVVALLISHKGLLFSPSELAQTVQQTMFPVKREGGVQTNPGGPKT